jgi:hypothetical protein
MRLKILALIIFTAFMMRCSSGGWSGDFAGGGVIGNPATSAIGYTDTIHCRVITTISVDGGGAMLPIKPTGQETARINQQQRYFCKGLQGSKRFLFSNSLGEQISTWSPDSEIVWTWTFPGNGSVRVQCIDKDDTSSWSEPLIIYIIE